MSSYNIKSQNAGTNIASGLQAATSHPGRQSKRSQNRSEQMEAAQRRNVNAAMSANARP